MFNKNGILVTEEIFQITVMPRQANVASQSSLILSLVFLNFCSWLIFYRTMIGVLRWPHQLSTVYASNEPFNKKVSIKFFAWNFFLSHKGVLRIRLMLCFIHCIYSVFGIGCLVACLGAQKSFSWIAHCNFSCKATLSFKYFVHLIIGFSKDASYIQVEFTSRSRENLQLDELSIYNWMNQIKCYKIKRNIFQKYFS